MRWQTTTALAVVLLLVGGFYCGYEVRWAPDRERAETRKGRVFQAEAADVTALELKRREDTVRFARAGEGWELKAPVVARGDRARIDETLTTVLTAKVDREIDPKPAAPGAFGLDKPAAEVTLTLKDGKTVGVALGNKSPTGASRLDLARVLRAAAGTVSERAGGILLLGRTHGARACAAPMGGGQSSVMLAPEAALSPMRRTAAAVPAQQLVGLELDQLTRL